MFFRKFALFVLLMFLGFGLSAKPASAAAKDVTENETTTETVADSAVSDDGTEVSDNDEDLVTDTDTKTDTDNTNTTTNSVTNNTVLTNQNSTTTIKNPSTGKSATKKTKKKANTKKVTYKQSDLRLMASIINCEAGGESMQGKIAVGVVVMNRVQSKSFPNTIKKVIYQKGQFSPVRNGSLRKKLGQYDAGKTHSAQWKSCILAAKKVLKGQRTIVIKGKVKNMSGYHFFSVRLPHARLKLGGHRFK